MQNINVNIVPDSYPQTIRYSQGDVGREFKINVVGFTIPTGATVKIQATKPSGFGFSVAGTVAGNAVSFTTTAIMTDEAGRFPAELEIAKDSVVIGTANFIMWGEANPHPEGTTDGQQGTIIPELTLLVERVEAAASSVLDMEVVANTLPAGSQATYSYDEDLNKATFGIPQGEAGAGAAGVVADAYSSSKTYKVGDYVLHNSNLYRCTTAITTAEAFTAAHWTQIVLADDVSDLKTDLDNISVENYLHPSEQIVGTLTKNYYVGTDGVPVSINGYAYLTVECEPKTTYLLSGYKSSSARLFVVKDSNGNVIDTAPSDSGSIAKDYEYITPSNASTLIVNTWYSSQPPIAKVYYPHEYVPNIPFVKQSGNDSLTIEEYVHPIETIDGTVTDGYYMDREGYPTAIAHFHYLTINCEPNTTYYISGQSGNRNRLFIVKDIMDNVIYVYPTGEGGVHNYEYTTPSNAHTLIVNGYDSASLTARVEKYEYKEFIKGNPIAKVVNENEYIIGNGDYSIRVLLDGSNNGAFNFSDFNRNGVKFKNEGDDVTPIWMTEAGYAGGNHGFEFGYRLTITSHGLTESDIGKTYNDGTNTWVLIKIISEDVIQVVCYDSSVWYKAKTATVPNSVNFGSSLSVESSVKAQIYPSIKNVNVEVIKNTKDECLILETYDVIHLGSGIDALISNVGDNTNDSLATLSDSAFTVRNLYSFLNNGSVAIYQNLKATSGGISLGWYGGTQSMALPNSNYIAVAETSITFQAVGGNSIEFSRSTWNDNTKPPILYMQADGSSGNNAMFLGFICENRNSELQDTAGQIGASSEKMYPMFINPNRVVNKGEVFNCITFRIPCHLNDVSNNVAYVCYTKVYNDYYVIISPNSATNTEVKLPNNLWNKKCEVYMSDGVTCNTEYVTDSVDIISEGRGYLILKLSE